jgi:hypothetical protein
MHRGRPQPLLIIVYTCVAAATAQDTRSELPESDYAEVRYGPHESNLLDIWLAG